MLKKLLLVSFLLYSCLSAQYYPGNARIGSLAETFVIDDINDVLRYSSYMNKYNDNLQVTFTSPIIGIKSIDDKFSIGFIANRGLMLSLQLNNDLNFPGDSISFYSSANAFVSRFIDEIPSLSIENQWIPHALFWVDAGVVSLGFDVFMEYARSKHNTDSSGTEVLSSSAAIYNPGVIASALLGTDNIPVALKFGISVPKIKGHQETPDEEIELESDKGIYLEFGGETKLPLNSFKFTLGTDLIFEKYAFEASDSSNTFPSREFSKIRTAIYAGMENKFFNNGIWAVQYTLHFLSSKSEESSNNWERSTNVVHRLSAALENSWDSLWIFDKVFTRGGMRMDIIVPRSSSELGPIEDKTKSQTIFEEVYPTVGLGIQKGIFNLDLSINLGDWDNLVTGPAVGRVTAGLQF